MSKVSVTITINERSFTTDVDREVLASRLKFAAKVSKFEGRRPGEPVDITKTSSDPISRERFHTGLLIYESLKEKLGQ